MPTFLGKRPQLVEKLIEKGTPPPNRQGDYIARSILSQEHWGKHPNLLKKLIETGHENERIAINALSQEHWTDNPELLVQFINQEYNASASLRTHVFSKEYWANHPELKAYVNGDKVSLESIEERLKEISFEDWREQRDESKYFSCKSIL